MDLTQVMRAAFNDELEKIAGMHESAIRTGRRPIGVDRLLERDNETNVVDMDVDGDTEEKQADAKAEAAKGLLSSVDPKLALGALGGAYALHTGQKVRRRYEMGRQMEQQGGY